MCIKENCQEINEFSTKLKCIEFTVFANQVCEEETRFRQRNLKRNLPFDF